MAVGDRVWVANITTDYDQAVMGIFADEDSAKDAVRQEVPGHLVGRYRFSRTGLGWQLRLPGHGVYGVYPHAVRGG